ncbi:hypothetical protein IWZ03DRAFT_139617 [Phyllosticta citriasiana]|uniref:Uncharacterized protein n=1 Tax=Phyllosticta citriasiana TaxID=595635 RepID=A0ABR1KU05_9PEZI
MPGSVASDESGDDVFIVDIDQIQAHGISAVDITKLKTNGYYTVAVSAFSGSGVNSALTSAVCPLRHTTQFAQD